MTTTFLQGVLRSAVGVPVAETRTLRSRQDLDGLSYYTLCALADSGAGANPLTAIPARGETWELDLDARGNFLAARRVAP